MSIHLLIIDQSSDEVKRGVMTGEPYLPYIATHLGTRIEFSGMATDYVVFLESGKSARHLNFQDEHYSCDDLIVIVEGASIEGANIDRDKVIITDVVELYDLNALGGQIEIYAKPIGDKYAVVFRGVAAHIDRCIELSSGNPLLLDPKGSSTIH